MAVMELETVGLEAVGVSAEEAEIYNRAADLMDERGLCQGLMWNGSTGELCVMGAVRNALDERYGAERPLVHHFVGEDAYRACVKNNDMPGRTKEEAVAVLRNRARHDGWSWN
jgi:hypothetical protein